MSCGGGGCTYDGYDLREPLLDRGLRLLFFVIVWTLVGGPNLVWRMEGFNVSWQMRCNKGVVIVCICTVYIRKHGETTLSSRASCLTLSLFSLSSKSLSPVSVSLAKLQTVFSLFETLTVLFFPWNGNLLPKNASVLRCSALRSLRRSRPGRRDCRLHGSCNWHYLRGIPASWRLQVRRSTAQDSRWRLYWPSGEFLDISIIPSLREVNGWEMGRMEG